MRDAFDGFLPTAVSRRFSKGYVHPFLTRRLAHLATQMSADVNRLRVVTDGYIDPQFMKDRLSGAIDGSLTRLGNLRNVAALELWLEARAGRFETSDILIERR